MVRAQASTMTTTTLASAWLQTHIPVVLPVIVSVSVVLVVSAIESVIVSTVAVIEVTVALGKERGDLRGFSSVTHWAPSHRCLGPDSADGTNLSDGHSNWARP